MEVLPGPLPDGRRSGGDEGLGPRLLASTIDRSLVSALGEPVQPSRHVQADRMSDFFLCAVGSTMSRQLNLFGKPVVRKAGPYHSSLRHHYRAET